VTSHSASALLADNPVDQLEVPLRGECLSRDEPLGVDDVQSLDELLSPGFCACHVALSLANVRSVDSRRISWLVEVHKRFCDEGGKLVIHSVWPLVMEALRFLRLDGVLHLADNEAAARQLLRQSEPVAAG
jgi:anti-anti-sigma regulatory factor